MPAFQQFLRGMIVRDGFAVRSHGLNRQRCKVLCYPRNNGMQRGAGKV